MAIISSLRPIPAVQRPIADSSKLRFDLATILFLVLSFAVISTSAGAQTYQPNSAYLGITFQTINEKNARRVGLSRVSGCIITKIKPNAPGDKGGLQVDDVMLEFNGRPVAKLEQFIDAMNDLQAGSVARIKLWRDGRKIDLDVKTGWSPYLLLGAEFFGKTRNITILQVYPHSPAAQSGLRKGDKVVRIEGRDVIEVGDATSALDGASLGATVMVEIERDGRAMSIPVRLVIGKAPGASAQ
jgi:S1-C subfamily serine protease